MDNKMFDYESASENLRIPDDVMRDFEAQARSEFPDDEMLMELHVLRAVKSYANRREIA